MNIWRVDFKALYPIFLHTTQQRRIDHSDLPEKMEQKKLQTMEEQLKLLRQELQEKDTLLSTSLSLCPPLFFFLLPLLYCCDNAYNLNTPYQETRRQNWQC